MFKPLSCFNKHLFAEVWFLIINGVRNKLSSVDNILPLTYDLHPQSNIIFNNFYGFQSILKLNFKTIFLIGIIKFITLCCSLIYPIILIYFLKFLINPNSNQIDGVFFLLGFFLNSLLLGFSSVYYNFYNSKLSLNLKSKLTPALLKEILQIPFVKLNFIHHGQLLDYLTADVDRIVNFFPSVQEVWSMPLQIIISIILLFKQVGFASFVGIAFILILIPLNKLLANKIGQYSSQFMHNKDGRMKIFTDFLQCIIGTKVGCYENIFYDEIKEKRQQELKYLKKQKYLDAFCVIFWAICPVVICALTFSVYILLGNEITTTKVLTSLALFNLLIGPMNALPWVINGIVEAMISLKRINSIQNTPIESNVYSIPYDLVSIPNTLIDISDVDFTWSHDSDDSNCDKIILFKNVNIEIKENEYIGIVGNVGSGKTSFLLAIMQEMNYTINGCLRFSESIKSSSIAFVNQKHWLLKKTIKDNIIMYQPYDPKWYTTIVDACGLNVDFSNMKNGDLTMIADNGNSLSGGQKSRICLARAIYHRAKIYLLDDPLSSLDSNVAWLIVEKVLSSLLVHSTIIMTTHNVRYFSKHKDTIRIPDKIFLIEKGNIIQTDSKLIDIGRLVYNHNDPINEKSESDELIKVFEDVTCMKQEHMEIGSIKYNIYFGYVKLVGYWLTGIIFSSLLLMQGTKNFSEYWLSLWTSSTNDTIKNVTQAYTFLLQSTISFPIVPYSNLDQISVNYHFKYFLKIYLIVVGCNLLVSIVRAFSFAYGGIRASYKIHNQLLSVLIRAKLQFFETTSRGQIINRFTSDLATIDDNLPFVLNILLANVFASIGSLLVVGISLPFVIVVILPIVYFCYYFQFVYRMTSRAIKRLISINRSPLYAHFSEMIEGMLLIRNFRSINNVIDENNLLLLNLIRCEFSGLLLSCWLSIRLQLIGISFVTAVVAISLIVNYFNYADKSLIGLACVYSFSLADLLSGVITYATESEKEFIAVERCFEYISSKDNDNCIVSEFQNDNLGNKFLHNPERCITSFDNGFVEFQHVYLRYTPKDSFALSDINIKIKSGETVGVVGRTGSGKSSLIKLLFRLYGYNEQLIEDKNLAGFCGKILINNMDIIKYNIRNLRYSLSVMMQESLIFSGSIRHNLDPLCQYCDDELHNVINKLQFNLYFPDFYTDGYFDLNGYIANQGRQLSFGQHQLLCLGRILLNRNDIICLDEPSAYLDTNTENIIENVILTEFAKKTVFIVGHRLPMLMRICDSLIVMECGKIIEYGTTNDLLQNPTSYLSNYLKS